MVYRTWSPTRSAGSPWRWALALALLTGLFGGWLPLAGVTRAAADLTITVTSAADPTGATGTCTLRNAVAAANAQATVGNCTAAPGGAGSGTTIAFALGATPQTITLGSTLPTLTQPVTLQGPGAALLTIRRDTANGVKFRLLLSDTDLDIVGVTLSGGDSAGEHGGGFYTSANATVTGSTFINNSAGGDGGGFYAGDGARVTGSTFTTNSANSGGGGFFAVSFATVTSSTFNENSAYYGGGFNTRYGTVVWASTFSRNTTDVGGGGFNTRSNATVAGSTFSGNIAPSTIGAGGSGFNADGNTSVTNSIFTNGATGVNCTIGDTFTDGGGVIASDATCVNGGLRSQVTDPKILALADNGGPTQTHALLGNSPARGIGIAADCAARSTDQRGVPRPATGCDSGALQTPVLALAPTTLPGGTFGTAYSQALTASGGSAPYSFGVTVGALPDGLTLATGGLLSGTPTAVGSFTFTVTTTDNLGFTGTHDFTFAIGKRAQTIDFATPAGNPSYTIGQPFTVGATASSGLAVSFAASGACTIAGTTVTPTGTGTCSVTASQAGNATYAAAPDVPRTFPVGKIAQTITFSTPTGTPTYTIGDTFTVGATASSSLAVTFAASGPCTVVGATVTTTGAGDCVITASQAGNATYAAAPDVPRTFPVDKIAQTIDFGTPTGSPSYTIGQPFTVGATASSTLTVGFAAGPAGVCTIAGTTVTATGAGVCTVTASQAGNATYAAAPQVPRTFPIGKRAQAIVFDTPTGTPAYTIGQTFTVGATASSGLPVAFAASGACTIADATVTTTGAGVCTVTASQTGDATYAAAPDVSRTFPVDKIAQTIDFATPTGTPAYTLGDTFTVGATASSGLAVTFAAGPAGVCTIASATVTTTGVGDCVITASQAGNSTYAAAPELPRTFPIGKITQTITFGTPTGSPSYTIGDTFTVGATASSGLPVTFAASGPCTVVGATVTTTGAGDCVITASQMGNATYAAAPEVPRTFPVNKIAQTIDFATPAGSPSYTIGQTFTIGATASSGLAVAFAASGPCTVVGATVTTTGAGVCTVTASQAGNATYAAAPELPRTFPIDKIAQTITFSTPTGTPTYTLGDTFTVGATASSTLTVTFAASGACTIVGTTVTTTGAGSCTVTASQTGDATYLAAPDVVRTFTVDKIAQTIDFATPAGSPTYTAGDTFTVGATASSGLTVSFAASGPCTIVGTTVTTTSAGNCVITASQAGDTTYAAAPEVPRTFPVDQAPQTITFATPAGNPSYTLGDIFTVGATASSGLPVTFAASGPCTVVGATVTTSGAGVCTVTASQFGDATYLAAPDVSRTFPINKIAQAITFGTPTGTPTYTVGDTFTVGATASSDLPVTFSATGPCSLTGTTVTATGAGTCTVTASQAGDETYAAAPEIIRTFPIGKRAQTIAFDTPTGTPAYTVGQTFGVGATASSGLPVTFAASGACSIAGTTVTTTSVGVCTVTASQTGDATYLAAPEVNRSFAVAIRQVLVTASTSGQGAVTPAGATSFAVGSQATYRAVPATGQVFVGWTLDDQPSGFASPLTFTVDTNRTLVANFAPRPTFADVAPGGSAWDGITQLAARGIIKGYGDGRFGENDTVLRAQVAALIVRAFGWDTSRPNGPAPFSDLGGVDPELQRAIATLAARGIINGYGDGTFGPTDEVTHAQVISFIARSMVQAGYWTAVEQDDPSLYPNVPLTSGHRLDLLTYARYAGAIPDRPANANWPDWQTPASRGWTAQVLWQALSSYLGTDRVP